MSRRCLRTVVIVLAGFTSLAALAGEKKAPASSAKNQTDDPLRMTPAVACVSVAGFRNFVTLEGAALTRDDKLLLYYEVENPTFEPAGTGYNLHLVQDVRLRRHGEKPVLWKKDKIVEYKPKAKDATMTVYLTNSIAVKECPPGEYDLEIILHDKLGPTRQATQTLKFRVKEPAKPKPPTDAKDEPEPRPQ